MGFYDPNATPQNELGDISQNHCGAYSLEEGQFKPK